jgi:putative transposase
MITAHKIVLDPNPAQENYFARACGTARFAYNWALAEWNREYKAGERPSEASLRRWRPQAMPGSSATRW